MAVHKKRSTKPDVIHRVIRVEYHKPYDGLQKRSMNKHWNYRLQICDFSFKTFTRKKFTCISIQETGVKLKIGLTEGA